MAAGTSEGDGGTPTPTGQGGRSGAMWWRTRSKSGRGSAYLGASNLRCGNLARHVQPRAGKPPVGPLRCLRHCSPPTIARQWPPLAPLYRRSNRRTCTSGRRPLGCSKRRCCASSVLPPPLPPPTWRVRRTGLPSMPLLSTTSQLAGHGRSRYVPAPAPACCPPSCPCRPAPAPALLHVRSAAELRTAVASRPHSLLMLHAAVPGCTLSQVQGHCLGIAKCSAC